MQSLLYSVICKCRSENASFPSTVEVGEFALAIQTLLTSRLNTPCCFTEYRPGGPTHIPLARGCRTL